MSVHSSHFDSHRFVKRLTNAGLSEEVAEISAEEHRGPILPADVATESDVAAIRVELATSVAELKEPIVETQRSPLKWMFGMMLAFAGIMLAAMANFR